MKNILIALLAASSFCGGMKAQSSYFPPLTGDAWEVISPSTLGWCQERIDSMYAMLEENNTKAFIVLKEGRIVLEKYFGTFRQDSLWYWASAGKSLTACLVGLAMQEGFLSLEDTTSAYLGQGWTDCTPQQESAIRIIHQISMTSGLDDGAGDPYCTLDTCLQYKADPGMRWAYHNAPYTLLDGVIEAATGVNLNQYVQQRIRTRTGINGLFIRLGYNNVFFSTARSMARFGLWMLHQGTWDGDMIMTDTAYVHQMMQSSQDLNLAYGYLWWLNGKSSYRLPGLQFVFPGSLMPNGPEDMVMALGKNGQYVNVVPSRQMVVIRMGNAPDGNEVPVTLNDEIWQHLNGLDCQMTQTTGPQAVPPDVVLSPVPATDGLDVRLHENWFDLELFTSFGQCIYSANSIWEHHHIPIQRPPGVYWVRLKTHDGRWAVRQAIWIQ